VTDIRKLSIELPGDQIAALEDAVNTGEYATTGDIVQEAIRDWQTKRDLQREDVGRLRQMWDEGKASGPPAKFDIERTLISAKKRLNKSAGK
jgi:antitoxin ParD1/3/4